MEYDCRGECGHKTGSQGCLAHLLRKLIEEAAEVLEALAESHPIDEDAVRKEWRDVEKVISGITTFHPWLLYGGEA